MQRLFLKEKYLNLRAKMVEGKMDRPFILAFKLYLFGSYLLWRPQLLESKSAYAYIDSIVNGFVLGWLFIVIASLYVFSTYKSYFKTKKVSAILTLVLWLFMFFSFFIREFNGYPNSGWVLILGTIILVLYELRTGAYEHE